MRKELRAKLPVAALFLSSFSAWGSSTLPPVTVCVEPETRPWVYWVRDGKNQLTSELAGISIDTIRDAFSRIGKDVKFIGDYPWARCMLMVESRQIDFAMDAYFDMDRARRFDYSAHYRTSTPQVFFRRANPISTQSVSDLKKLKGCGLNGWSYGHYGLASESLDLGIGMENMVLKLKAKRCDYFVEEMESIYGEKLSGRDYLADPTIAYSSAPWAKPPTSHLMASKNSEASKLLPDFDKALKLQIKSGAAVAIWKKYAADLTFKP